MASIQASDIGFALKPALEDLAAALSSVREEILCRGGVRQGIIYSPELGEPIEHDIQEGLAKALSDIDCQDASSNGSVWRYPGVIEASDGLITRIRDLNSAKHELEHVARSLQRAGATEKLMRQGYRLAGYPRIHPLQAWRQIVLLEGKPESVGFTVSKRSEGTVRLTRDETVAKLREHRAFDIAEGVLALPEGTEISWHVPVSPHIKANVVWGEGASAVRQMFHASLPFIVGPDCWPGKRVRYNHPRDHAKRSDCRGTVIAYLPFREGAYLKAS